MRNGLGSVVAALIAGQMEGLERAIVALQIFGNGLATSEGDLICVEVQHLESIVLEQMLHDDVEAIVAELMLSN